MSNVLIGIIGVILFIGLALAGALILGEDFRSASNDTKAAQISQTIHQIASAASMYEVKTGRQLMDGDQGLLMPRFLKSIPSNPIYPTSSAYTHQYMLSYQQDNPGSGRSTLQANFVVLFLYAGTPAGDVQMKAVCDSINSAAGVASSAAAVAGPSVFGCVDYAGRWIAFERI